MALRHHTHRQSEGSARAAVLLVAISLWLVGGCVPHAAVVRFSNEFHCPQDQVQIEDLGAQAYRVTGCDRRVTYICVTNAINQSAGICSLDAEGEIALPQSSTAGGTEGEDVRRAPPRPTATATRVEVGGVEVPALRMMLSGMPLTFAPVPGSQPSTFLVAVTTSYGGQQRRCEALEIAGDAGRIEATRQAGDAVLYRVEADALRAVTAGESLRIAVCHRSMWLSRPQRTALATLAETELQSDPPQRTAGAPTTANDDDGGSAARCSPPCSPGYDCRAGTCVALCNPPCSPGFACGQDRICHPVDDAPEAQ